MNPKFLGENYEISQFNQKIRTVFSDYIRGFKIHKYLGNPK